MATNEPPEDVAVAPPAGPERQEDIAAPTGFLGLSKNVIRLERQNRTSLLRGVV